MSSIRIRSLLFPFHLYSCSKQSLAAGLVTVWVAAARQVGVGGRDPHAPALGRAPCGPCASRDDSLD